MGGLLTSTPGHVLLAFVLAWFVVPHVRINKTDSIPRGLYWATGKTLIRGAYATECLPLQLVDLAKERNYLEPGGCPGNVMAVVKKVVGLPGDLVEFEQEYVAVNGELLFNSMTRETDSQGRPLPAYPRGSFILQPGKYLLMGTNSLKSWDDRYKGPTDSDNIKETWRPIFTEAGNGL